MLDTNWRNRAHRATATVAGLVLAGSVACCGIAYAQDTPVTVATVRAQIAALSCDASFARDQGAITDNTFTLIEAGVSASDLGALTDALNARLKVLNFCVGGPTTTPTTLTTTTAPSTPTTSPSTVAKPDDQDCSDFATQADAQAHLIGDRTDPDRIDVDVDGRACEEHFAAADLESSSTQVAEVPVGSVDTGRW